MPHVRIVHRTEYRYNSPVGLLSHRLMLRPQDSHDLRLRDAMLAVDPPPASTRWAHDVFGNSICLLEWPADLRTEYLHITSSLELTHYPSGLALKQATLEPSAETFPFSYDTEEVPDLARLSERHLPDPDRLVDAWARRFVGGGEPISTLAMLEAMTLAIQQEFSYSARHAEGTQTPVETLALGSGTCRDFALLMMEALRSHGLAARFVTGYLYDDSASRGRGGGSTHGWCAVYLPGAGWVEYDPTNGLMAGRNLLRIAVTRTPEQATPICGGFLGERGAFAGMSVDVQVSLVQPEEPREAPMPQPVSVAASEPVLAP